MSLKNYFFPEKMLKDIKSDYNKQVEVVKFSGQLRLDMGNLIQSGEIIANIWRTAADKLLPKKYKPKNILILGFGAGSAAHMFSKKYKGVKITGVELDPVVIKLAKKYFKADEIPGLKIVNANALHFVAKNKNHYDLVVVDTYIGDSFPKELKSASFYKKILSFSDHVLVNRLFWADHKEKAIKFVNKLEKHFPPVATTRTASNLLIHLESDSEVK